MQDNVIDVTNLLTLTSNQPTAESPPTRQNSKHKPTFTSSSSNELLKISSTTLKHPRQSSTKTLKKKPSLYEIVDNSKMIVYRGVSASSYTFDHIQDNGKKFQDIISWIFNKKKIVEEIQMNVACKLIIAHNYSPTNSENFMETIGKRLLSEGFSFEIYCFWDVGTEKNFFQVLQRKKRNQIPSKNQPTSTPSTGIGKNIKFITQLKQYINDIRCIRQPISKFWIIGPYLSLGVGICTTYRQQFAVEMVEQLIVDFHNHSKEKNDHVNFKVALCTLSQVPNEGNLESCRSLFQDAILLKDCVRKYAISRKKSQFNVKRDNKADENRKIKKYNISPQKDCEFQKSKISKSYSQKFPIRQQLQKQKNSQNIPHQQASISSSDQSLQFSKKPSTIQKYAILSRQSQNNMASLMAENMNLKWQLQTLQKSYEQQSEKYLQKNNKKFQTLREQRSYILQQNAKLRKDNEDLLLQLTTLKTDYQLVLKTRAEYEEIIKNTNQQKQKTITKNAEFQIKKLQQKLREVAEEKERVEKELINLKTVVDDGRRRNKERVEEATDQINRYKKFCQELKVAYDELQKQANLDKDRCENLEKRCKKYQETLSDLLKLKDGKSSSGSIEFEQSVSILNERNRSASKSSEVSEQSKSSNNKKLKKQQLEQKLFGEQAKRARKWSRKSQKTLNYYQQHKENKRAADLNPKQQQNRQKLNKDEAQMLISFGK